MGAVLYTYYSLHPKHLRGLPRMDALLPFFVLHEVGGILSGLVIASIFAASMAVLSASINSLTTATTVDFYKRLLRPNRNDSHYVLVGRLGTVGWGATATIVALFVYRLGPIVNAFNIINSLLGGPILGIFLLGVLTQEATGTGAVVGGALGLAAVSLIACKSQMSFFYYALIGTVVTFVVGYMIRRLGSHRDPAELHGLVRGLNPPALITTPVNRRTMAGR